MTYIPPSKTLPAFPNAVRVKSKSKRMRWKEWDSLHGKIEKYNRPLAKLKLKEI